MLTMGYAYNCGIRTYDQDKLLALTYNVRNAQCQQASNLDAPLYIDLRVCYVESINNFFLRTS